MQPSDLPSVEPAGVTRFGRRGLLGLAAAGLAASVPVRASQGAIVSIVAIGRDGWLFPVYDGVKRFDVPLMQGITKLVNEAVGEMDAAGLKVALVLTPAKSRVMAEYLPPDFQWTPDAKRRYGATLEVLRQGKAVVPDLDAVMANLHKTRPNDLLFFKSDTHWTTLGAEPTAAAVAAEIKAQINLPPSARPGTQFGPAVETLQTNSDLADNLPKADQSKYPLINFPRRKVIAPPGQAALTEDDPGDTIVIGNSWMQPAFNFAGMLSNQLNRPVALNWRVHQISPYKNLLDALTGPLFQKGKTKLIVWNLHELDFECPIDSKVFWGPTAMPAATFMASLRKAVRA